MGVRVRGLQPWASPGGTRRVRVGEVQSLPHLLASRLEGEGIVERLDQGSRRSRPAPEVGPTETPTAVEEYHVGGGWFRPPGADRAMRHDEALAFLRDRGSVGGDEEA